MSFFQKFFLYYESNGSYTSYSDQLGSGAFVDIRHYLWLILIPLIAVIGYQFFKKYPKAGKMIVMVLAVSLFTFRLGHQTARAILGVENPWTQAFPFHMCTVLTFLLPLTIVFKWKKIETPVYVLAMMGGIITALMGDYFSSQFMNMYTLEGMSAHTLLILLPIYQISLGRFKLEFKNSLSVVIGVLILMGWATLANEVFYVGLDPNYMYLRHNGLPGDLGGEYYFLIYTGIFFIFFGLIFGIPESYRKLNQKPGVKIKQSMQTS
jgi:uncharacterized membrane protein YwaF